MSHQPCANAIRELTLFSRYGCHLCEDMLLSLNDYARDFAFHVKVVDIDDDPQLRALYNEAVPVLQVNNREVCRHFLDLNALREALDAPSDVYHHQAI